MKKDLIGGVIEVRMYWVGVTQVVRNELGKMRMMQGMVLDIRGLK